MYRSKNVDVLIAVGIAILGWYTAIAGYMPSPVAIIFGAGLFIAPGYVWSEVLLSQTVATLERLVVAVGLAFIVPVVGGIGLHAAGILLYRKEWIGLLGTTTIVGGIVLAIQRVKKKELPITRQEPYQQGRRKRLSVGNALVFGLAAAIATGAVTLAVVGAEAQKYPGYTQLWLTPQKNKSLQATLGVTNQEGFTTKYRLVLRRKGRTSETWNLTLANGSTWKRAVPYTTKYLITADLYRLPDLGQPFRNVDNGS